MNFPNSLSSSALAWREVHQQQADVVQDQSHHRHIKDIVALFALWGTRQTDMFFLGLVQEVHNPCGIGIGAITGRGAAGNVGAFISEMSA